MAEIPDTSGIPSTGAFIQSGTRDPAKLTDRERLLEAKRQRRLSAAKLVQELLEESELIAELRRTVGRQQADLDLKDTKIQSLETKLNSVTEEVKAIKAAAEEYRQWEGQIYEHVASVDEKAARLSELSQVLFGIVKLLHIPLPIMERTAHGMLRISERIKSFEKRQRSRADGADITGLVDKPGRSVRD